MSDHHTAIINNTNEDIINKKNENTVHDPNPLPSSAQQVIQFLPSQSQPEPLITCSASATLSHDLAAPAAGSSASPVTAVQASHDQHFSSITSSPFPSVHVPYASLPESSGTAQVPEGVPSSSNPLTIVSRPASDALAHYTQHGQPDCKFYPQRLATQEDVLGNRDLFFQTLNNFHSVMGTKFMIPVIGGKDLDLHILYREVTSRGGINQVIKDRKWKEITTVFNFPATATNASFVVRKYYMSLLYHYEQVYFNGAQGQPILPPDITHSSSPGSNLKPSGESSPVVEFKHKKRKKTMLPPMQGDPSSLISQPVTGVIDGKLESAYLVTVTVGSEKLKGVLYQMPAGLCGEQFAKVYDHTKISDNSNPDSNVRQRRRRRRRNELRRRDPNHPKPNRSGYNFFFQEQHAKLKLLHPGKDREISKMIGDSWNNLTEDEKAVYQERGVKDKERYKSEMLEYKERLKVHSQEQNPLGGAFESNEVESSMKTEIYEPDAQRMVSDNATIPIILQHHTTFSQVDNDTYSAQQRNEQSTMEDKERESSSKVEMANIKLLETESSMADMGNSLGQEKPSISNIDNSNQDYNMRSSLQSS